MLKMSTNSKNILERIERDIDASADFIKRFFIDMLRIKAVNPKGGGEGEGRRADFIERFLRNEGFEVRRVDAVDKGAGGIGRPNLSAKIRGKNSTRTLWIISHLDTVPEGSRELWRSDPFEPYIKDGKIIARGAEDNGQSVAASILSLIEIKKLGIEIPFDFGIWLVADEEAGSEYGVKFLLDKKEFKKEDLILVPDAGSPDGLKIEIAEKSLLWLKIVTEGKQVHASRPSKGLNASRIAMEFALSLDKLLHQRYSKIDRRFDEHISTFEPTKRELNVSNINTIPGLDIAYFDCRIIPEYPVSDVVYLAKNEAERFSKKSKAKVTIEIVQREDAGKPTSESSDIARLLAKAIEFNRKKKPKYVGIGGQTVGNLFRKEGIPAAVWSTIDNVAHEPNEYCKFNNLLNDAKVFASLPVLATFEKN
jgi:succinyl-diaminopimelate desuccinylase